MRELLDAGLTIGDIRAFVHLLDRASPSGGESAGGVSDTCPVAEVAAQRVVELDRRIERLTELRNRLTDALAYRFAELFRDLGVGPDRAA